MKCIKLPVISEKCSEASRFRIPDWASLVRGSVHDQAMHKAGPAYSRYTRWGSLASVGNRTRISHHNA